MSDCTSVMGPCVCGGSPREPNYECERCRMVYAIRLAGQVRAAQKLYFAGRTGGSQDKLLADSKALERKFDRVLDKLLAPPAQEPRLFGADETYYQNGG